MTPITRRSFVRAGAAAGLVVIAPRGDHDDGSTVVPPDATTEYHGISFGRVVTVDAKPAPIQIDLAKTALLVIDMQNDFGAEGGFLHRSGIDISGIRAAVAPTARVLATARAVGMKTVYLKMAFRPDLSDAGSLDSPCRVRHLLGGAGKSIRAPNGAESRILIRDTWNTDIIPELAPRAEDIVLYKHRFSGFYETQLDAVLKRLGVKYLVVTGCTTSICVESTLRDAYFRDYSCTLLSDCAAEPIGHEFPRGNHEATLLNIEVSFGWVPRSDAFIGAVTAPATSSRLR